MKVVVDRELCQGHARCILKAPTVFELDDIGHAITPEGDVPAEREHEVRMAIANCPEGAISIQ